MEASNNRKGVYMEEWKVLLFFLVVKVRGKSC